MKNIIKNILLLPITFFLIVWGASLLKCSVLTIMLGKEFETAYTENTMIGDIDYLRILEYSENFAKVYYVSKNRSGGNVLSFKKENGKWKYNNWEETVWSATGSASDVIWPYWWHFIYGGF